MKYLVTAISFLLATQMASGQNLDSIFFNLYTDSLKKGTYNYINIEGRFSDGTFLPLSDKELKFTSSAGKFSGNSLYVDSSFTGDKVTVKAVLLKNPGMWREMDIYIKKHIETERLPTMEEVMNRPSKDTSSQSRKKRGKKKG
jgi:hypothetical protein